MKRIKVPARFVFYGCQVVVISNYLVLPWAEAIFSVLPLFQAVVYISISHSSQVVPTLLVQGPHFEHQGNEHLPFALAETLSTLLCARRSCVDGVTQIFKTPYLGGPIIITTILQLSKFS